MRQRTTVFFAALASIAFIAGTGPDRAFPAASDPAPASRILSMEDAIVTGLRRNLNLEIARLSVPAEKQGVAESRSAFDPVFEGGLTTEEEKYPTGSVLYDDAYRRTERTEARAGVGKRFDFGLESRLSARGSRTESNSLANSLDPQYRQIFVLELTQPLLRGFGRDPNTSDIRISQNRVREAALATLHQARSLSGAIESAYFDLVQAQTILDLQIEFRELARQLAEGNAKRQRAGMIPITQVRESKTAVLDRDEQVLLARQGVEMAANRLKDLMEIRSGGPPSTTPLRAVHRTFPELQEALVTAFNERADLRRLHVALESRNIRLAFLKNQRLPRLDLTATLGLNGLTGDDQPVQLFGQRETSPLEGDWNDHLERALEGDGHHWAVGLKFSYPLGNRAADARYQRGQLKKRQVIYSVKRLEGTIETEIRNALVQVERSLQRVETADRFADLAWETLQGEMKRLSRGLSNTFRILDQQEDLIAARIRAVRAAVDFHQGLAGLYTAMGTNLRRYGIMAEIEAD